MPVCAMYAGYAVETCGSRGDQWVLGRPVDAVSAVGACGDLWMP